MAGRDAVRAYLRHFWHSWSGPGFALGEDRLSHLVDRYGSPGAFMASIKWYRAGAPATERYQAERPPDPADRITVPTSVLWPCTTRSFPSSGRIGSTEYFLDVRLRRLENVGHFVPVEAADAFADAIRGYLIP